MERLFIALNSKNKDIRATISDSVPLDIRAIYSRSLIKIFTGRI